MIFSPPSVAFYLADQNPHRDRSRGITGYSLQLAEALERLSRVELRYLTSKSSAAPARSDHSRCLPVATDGPILRLAVDHLHGPFLPPATLCHYPKGFLPFFLPSTPRVTTIHDTIIQHYVDHYPAARSRSAGAYWSHLLRYSIARSDHVITVSEFSRRAILSFCDRFAIRPPPITVTYQGCFDDPVATNRTAKQTNQVVALASPLPHKKIDRLLELWRLFETRHPDHPGLLLVGDLTPHQKMLASSCRNVQSQTIPTTSELLETFASARALIFPSEIEGFGLPALEATFVGTPVVFVEETATAEILDHPAIGGFSHADPDSFESAVAAVLSMSPDTARELAARLREKYAWRKIAERTLAVYEQVAISHLTR